MHLERLAVAIALLAIFNRETPAAVPEQRVQVWQRWERTLSSAREYTNAYADVVLRVTYTGPGERMIRAYGFWDGGQIFRIRCAFPVPGTWRWQTECSDSSDQALHAQHGAVEVSPYTGSNALYQHGFLRVSDNRRYLTFADRTPFLWIGDTAWAAPHRSSPEEWEEYLSDRASKHFTVIQVGLAPEWAGGTDRQGQKPFTERSCAQWNPAYWEALERKIQRANERGLVVMVVGLMEPVYRYPESSKACVFARNIVARLFGNFVVFSPSFDSEVLPLANEVGRAARDATTVHLITQHPGTPWNQPTPTFSDKYYDEPYMDFAGVQTGHNGGHLDWCAHHAIEWNLHLYGHKPHKPVVNLEAMYDARGTNGWRAVDARSLGWRTFLSGGVGYTYGAGDLPPKVPQGNGAIWKWVTDPEKYDYWKKALQWESAFQMQHLHDLLATVEWWRLEPAHELIRTRPADVTRRAVLAKSAAGDLAIAYLPTDEAVEIDLSRFPGPMKGRWLNPVQGTYTELAGAIENAKKTGRFEPPGDGDWVLLLCAAEGTNRSFRMGFTGFVYDMTPEAVSASRKFVRENGDILAHHIEGVPWTEALNGQPFPKALLEEWEGKKLAAPPNGKIYLAISPGRGDLKVADKAGPLPAELKGRAYDDPLVMKAYLSYCRRAIDFFKPDYLAIGIEVNEIYSSSAKSWEAYVTLHRRIYQELKKEHPDLPIFASWTLHNLFKQRGQMLEQFKRLMPCNDLVAVSYYPFFMPDKDRLGALDWMFEQFDSFGKPYAVVETNDEAERLPLPRAKVVIEGTPEKQTAYYRRLLSLAQQHEFAFVISFIHQDYDGLWEKIKATAPELFMAWRDCGLLDENGKPRPALQVWKEYFSRPLARSVSQ